jgi:hypothetical protein
VDHWIYEEDDASKLLEIGQEAIALAVMAGLVAYGEAQIKRAPQHGHREHDELPPRRAKRERHIHVARDENVGGPASPKWNRAPQNLSEPVCVATEAQESSSDTKNNQEVEDFGQLRRARRRRRQVRCNVRPNLGQRQPHTVGLHAPREQL